MNLEKNKLEIKEVTEEEYIEILKWLFGEDAQIIKEKDWVYKNIYYTKQIQDLIQTKSMQRLRKILQLGSTIINMPTASHNRLQHSKGAAHRCLEFYAIQARKTEWKEYIEENNLKGYLVEKLKYMYCHDIGHAMQSHSIERVIGDKNCNHEKIGKKICREDNELKETLSNIKADNEKDYESDNTLESFCEGNIDFDRMDYLSRDLLFAKGKQVEQLPLILNTLVELKDIEINGETKKRYVYSREAMPYIELFLQLRDHEYKTNYRSKQSRITDYIDSYMIERIKDGKCIQKTKLEEVLNGISNISLDEINIDEYLQTNDIFWLNQLIQIAENEENYTTKEIATYLIPTHQGLLQSALTIIEPENREKETYGEDEKELIRNIKRIIKGQSSISQEVNDKKWKEKFTLIHESNNKQEIKNLEKEIMKKLGINECIKGIKYYETTYKIYDSEYPIYVEGENDKIYTFDKHPDLKIDLTPEKRYGIFIIPTILKEQGIEEKKIERDTWDR